MVYESMLHAGAESCFFPILKMAHLKGMCKIYERIISLRFRV